MLLADVEVEENFGKGILLPRENLLGRKRLGWIEAGTMRTNVVRVSLCLSLSLTPSLTLKRWEEI